MDGFWKSRRKRMELERGKGTAVISQLIASTFSLSWM
jgi:hypothetical protein